MRGLSARRGPSWRRIFLHADYVSSHVVGGGLIASVAIIAGIHAFGIITMGVSSIDALTGMLFVTGLLYAILASLTVTSMADDLGEGYAALYLAHPLSRAEYYLAWVWAGPILVVTAYLLSVAAPMLALKPASLLDRDVYRPLASIVGQISFHTSIAVYSSIVLKNKNRANLAVLGVMILAPVLVMFVGVLVASALHVWDYMEALIKVIGVFHPALLYLPFAGREASVIPSLVYGFGASLFLYYMAYRTFKDRTDI